MAVSSLRKVTSTCWIMKELCRFRVEGFRQANGLHAAEVTGLKF